MNIVGDTIYSEGRLFRGYVEFDKDLITDVQEGEPPEKCETRGLVIPLLTNSHSHIADAFLRGEIDDKISFDALVRPPDSLKHVELAKREDTEVIQAIGRSIEEMRKEGIRRFIDFREGGLRGLEQMMRAIRDHPFPEAITLTRPERMSYSEEEVDLLLDQSDGIGVSAISDWNYDILAQLAEHAHSRNGLFALHASEGRREDIGMILDLRPDFLVHMSSATNEDLQACLDDEIPIVVCPRSNIRFGIDIDIARMIDIGLDVSLGTDNAMLHPLSMIDEMRAAYGNSSNSRRLKLSEILKLAVDNSQKILRDRSIISIRPGNRCEFMVIRTTRDSPPEAILSGNRDYSIELI